MKRILSLISLIAITAACLVRAAEPAATLEDCIRNFYRWYVTALIANKEPMKHRAEMTRYATERLLKEIDKMEKGPGGLDGDYFIDAQDFDPLWAKKSRSPMCKLTGTRVRRTCFWMERKGCGKNCSSAW
jgi:hypothetical protein